LAAEQVGQRRRLAAIRHVRHADARHHIEQLAADMAGRADAAGAHMDLAGIGLGIVDELGTVLAGSAGLTAMRSGRRYIDATGAMLVFKLKRELVVERCVDRGR
jgi:hypothetical protein